MKNGMYTGLSVLIVTVCILAIYSCSTRAALPKALPKEHYMEVRERGFGMIYIDKVPNAMTLRKDRDTTGFISILVGFLDSSAITDKARKEELGRYYRYEMNRDWALVNRGDSLRPVFYQERQQLDERRHETVLVFELPGGVTADTLSYGDGLHYWGKHIIYLNQ